MKKMLTLTLGLGLLAGAVQAEPFRMADVAADAKWIAHADVDTLKGTRLGDRVLDKLNENEVEVKLEALEAVFNFDPREDLSGLTLYGSAGDSQEAVAVIRGNFDAKRLVTLIRAGDTYKKSTHGAHRIHSWIDEEEPDKRKYGSFPDDNTLVISDAKAMVKDALDVLDGTGKSLSPSGELGDAVAGNNGSFFIAAVNMAELPDLAPDAAMLKKARAFQLSLGEAGSDVEGTLRLTATDEDVAEQVQKVLEGMIAFAHLNQEDQPELLAIAKAAEITRDGNVVEVVLRHPADEVIAFLEEQAEKDKLAKAEAESDS